VQLAGDLSGTAIAPIIGVNKVTYSKMQQVSAQTILGNSTISTANVQEVSLGTLSFSGTTLNSPFSFYTGFNPNISSPVDRPLSNKVVYIGDDNALWIYDGVYLPVTPFNLLAYSQTNASQTLNLNTNIQFNTLTIPRTSTQGLSITATNSNSVFDLQLNTTQYPQAYVKMTVSILGLSSNIPGTFEFFTFSGASYTGPGTVLSTGYTAYLPSTGTYSQILSVPSFGGIIVSIRLRNIAPSLSPPTTISLDPITDAPNVGRWILFEEV
jgi:hypothetical protein